MSTVDRNQQVLKKFLVGGASIGAGTALVTSLLNYIANLKKRTQNDTSGDDNTLYINLPGEKQANVLHTGGAMAGGALAAMGSYALVKQLYTQLRKRQLQKEVDEAQQIHLSALEQEAEAEAQKSAAEGKPLGMLETLSSIPVASSLLLALASGALTNHMLDKTFPSPKAPTFKRPRRIVVRQEQAVKKKEAPPAVDSNPEAETPAEEDHEKVATFRGDEVDGLDYLAGLVMSQPGFAQKSELPDLVGAVATGRTNEFFKMAREVGHDAAFAAIKGASEALNDGNRIMATAAALRSPLVGPMAQAMVTAEAFEMFPNHCKMARSLDPTEERTLFALACWAGACTKSAALMPQTHGNPADELPPELLAELQKIIETSDSPETAEPNPDGSDTEGQEQATTERGDEEPNTSAEDVIDVLMGGKQAPQAEGTPAV